MRSSLSRFATTTVVGLLVVACASATSPAPVTTSRPSGPPASSSASATPTSTPSATPGPTGAPTASPSLQPSPASATLPVRGSGEEIGRDLQMTPGPAGGLFVSIDTEHYPGVAILDSSGKPRPGLPIACGGAPALAADGSIRAVCGNRAYAFAPDGRPMAGWPVELPGELRRMARRRPRPLCAESLFRRRRRRVETRGRCTRWHPPDRDAVGRPPTGQDGRAARARRDRRICSRIRIQRRGTRRSPPSTWAAPARAGSSGEGEP